MFLFQQMDGHGTIPDSQDPNADLHIPILPDEEAQDGIDTRGGGGGEQKVIPGSKVKPSHRTMADPPRPSTDPRSPSRLRRRRDRSTSPGAPPQTDLPKSGDRSQDFITRQVWDYLQPGGFNKDEELSGSTIDDIHRHLTSMGDFVGKEYIKGAITTLGEEGLIYSTIDDHHWKAAIETEEEKKTKQWMDRWQVDRSASPASRNRDKDKDGRWHCNESDNLAHCYGLTAVTEVKERWLRQVLRMGGTIDQLEKKLELKEKQYKEQEDYLGRAVRWKASVSGNFRELLRTGKKMRRVFDDVEQAMADPDNNPVPPVIRRPSSSSSSSSSSSDSITPFQYLIGAIPSLPPLPSLPVLRRVAESLV